MTDTPFHHVAFHIATVCPSYTGTGFPPLLHHIPVSAVVLALVQDDVIITSKTIKSVDESRELTEFFFEELQGGPYHLVSFKGRSFSLPVMVYNALRYGVDASSYLAEEYQSTGGKNSAVHTDLLDWLTNYGLVGGTNLAAYVQMVGLPARVPSGHQIATQFANGQTDLIEGNLSIDVMLTAALFLRTLLVSGQLTKARYTETAKSVMKHFFDHNEAAEAFLGAIDRSTLRSFWMAGKV